jgi:hypothetical protein
MFRLKGHWVVVYDGSRGECQSVPMPKKHALNYLAIFKDAVYITKISGWFRGKIIERKGK